mgnify:CR=1 FL=1
MARTITGNHHITLSVGDGQEDWDFHTQVLGLPAERTDTALALHDQLFNSPGHRMNMLNPDWREAGIGLAQGEYKGRAAVDVTEDDNEIVVRAEIPGIDPDKVDVSISGNSLLLSGQKDESYEDRGKDYYRSERRFGSFRRRIDLPESVDADRITAEYDAGVLLVRAPKRQGAGSKKIPISTASSPRRRGS